MNKPDWKDAPEWANYLAMDADGEWYWYGGKPNKSRSNIWWEKVGEVELALKPSGSWEDSLETPTRIKQKPSQ